MLINCHYILYVLFLNFFYLFLMIGSTKEKTLEIPLIGSISDNYNKEDTHCVSKQKEMNMADAGLLDIVQENDENNHEQFPSKSTINTSQKVSKSLEAVVTPNTRDKSKMKFKPTWKLRDNLGIDNSNKITGNINKKQKSNDIYEDNVSAADVINLEMEVFNSHAQNYQESSGAMCHDFQEETEATESNVSLSGIGMPMETEIGHALNHDTKDKQHKHTVDSIETSSGENVTKERRKTYNHKRCLNPVEQNERHSLQNQKIIISTADSAKVYIIGTDKIKAFLVSVDHTYSKPCMVKDVDKEQGVQTEGERLLDDQANFAPASSVNTLRQQLSKSDPDQETTNLKGLKLNKSVAMVEQTHLRGRDNSKRKVKPAWKLNDYLGSGDTNQKLKPSCKNSKQTCKETVIATKDSFKNKIIPSTPQKNGSRMKACPKAVLCKVQEKKTINMEMWHKLKRLRKQNAKNFSCSEPLHFIDQDDTRFVYYLLPKEIVPNAPVRKMETLSDVKQRKVVLLEDYPQSYCIENYTDLAPGSRHKSAEENQSQRFLCKICNVYRTVLLENLRKHIELHVNDKLNCKLCSFIAHSVPSLRNHMIDVHQTAPGTVICEMCGAYVNSYKLHVSKVHGIAAYKCFHCSFTFHKDTELREHVFNEHKGCAYQCEICKQIFLKEGALLQHLPKCGVKLYSCKYCDKFVQKSRELLRAHIRKVHAKTSTHKCNICSFSAESKKRLTAHMNAHLNIHPYACELCNFTCVKKDQLNSHMRTHSGEKKYKCDKCSYAAAWNVQLKSHLKAHISDNQCLCKVCNIVLKDQRCLKLHTRKEHRDTSQ